MDRASAVNAVVGRSLIKALRLIHGYLEQPDLNLALSGFERHKIAVPVPRVLSGEMVSCEIAHYKNLGIIDFVFPSPSTINLIC